VASFHRFAAKHALHMQKYLNLPPCDSGCRYAIMCGDECESRSHRDAGNFPAEARMKSSPSLYRATENWAVIRDEGD